MSFYSAISTYYNYIFPVKNNVIKFLSKSINEKSLVLDVACGTGGQCFELGHNSSRVLGLDLDRGMIDKALSNNKAKNVNFREMNMININKLSESFDLIYCIGNSIVHLDSIEDINGFIANAYSRLNRGGELIIQTINYDRVVNDNVKSLPTIVNDEANLVFERNYNLIDNNRYVEFNTILSVDNQILENTVNLITLKKDELCNCLKNVGFRDIKFYSAFDETSYDKKGYATIVRAVRS